MTQLNEPPARPDLPVGTVTFLRTDIEGSMALARTLGRAWDDVVATHFALLRTAVARHAGVVVRTEGDAMFAAFPEAGAAAAAAVEAQRSLAAQAWPAGTALRVRMGLHSGEAHRAGDDYGGMDANRAARVAAAGHGGQILVSSTTRALIEDALPVGTVLDDLGSHQLRDLPRPERLGQLTVDGLPATFPPPRSGGPAVGDLGQRLTSFLGREAEIEAIVGLADRARLITLHGPGGIGKTSLAVEVARRLAPRFRDGAWFVPLADLDDAGALDGAIAHGVGLFDGPERTARDALVPYLADRSVLLVLDNMEHLLASADRIGAILHASPGSQIIVTSRAPLHVSGEHEVPVPPLRESAVALFTERARAVKPDFEPRADRAVIVEICALLDDLPLGIELAAARVALLSPAVIRDRLAARLPLPGQGTRDAPARQRTLEGAVAWSHELLEPRLQELLHTLGVFENGFDVREVESVSPAEPGRDRLEDLLELADRNLMAPDSSAAPGGVRFRLLRTIQSFALDRLAATGREPDIRRRHALAYAALGAASSPHLNTSRHVEMLDRVLPEIANLRAADRWAIDHDEGELALRLVAEQWRFWHASGQMDEGRRLTEEALAMPSAPTAGLLRVRAADAAGSLAYWQADTARARSWYEEQVRLARAADDERAIADGLFNLSHVVFIEEDDEAAALSYVDEVVARFRDLGDERSQARAEWARGVLALGAGRLQEAVDRLEQGLVRFERLDDPQYYAMSVATLGWAAFTLGDLPKAIRYAIDSVVKTHEMRDVGTTTISLHVGVLIGAMTGRLEEAAVIDGAFEALCERYGVRPPQALDRFLRTSDPFVMVREQLDPTIYANAKARGRRLDLDAAVALVRAIGDEAATTGPAAPAPD